MESDPTVPIFSVSDFVASLNQTLEYAYPSVEIEGEVASFKVNQGKWVFFDLKDAESSVGCFVTLYQLRVPIEDGMKVVVSASAKMTKWGKFSLTVRAIRPKGEGSLRKSFELLKAKLDKEGLFALDRKRPLPELPAHVGVISSTQAAGYADFVKILNDRWGGVKVDVAHVQVQGADAPDQMIRAINYFNAQEVLPEVLVIIRGGGSADDLSAFNDELLVRAIASSRIPTLVGVGHEIDETLADLAADVRAATPSNAAQLLVPDRAEVKRSLMSFATRVSNRMERVVSEYALQTQRLVEQASEVARVRIGTLLQEVATKQRVLEAYDPRSVLERGYAIVRGVVRPGEMIVIERKKDSISAEVTHVTNKAN